MTHLITDANTFAAESIAGFVAANRRYARQVDGGVVRSTVIPPGRVAVVIGGGSGHYPAFAGLVGSGLAAGAVCGNIFASPSSGQAYRVAKTVERGAGILLSFGNYAGDVLQFGQAQERLRGEGFDVRTVLVTDDVASAPPEHREKRRGIAGDLAVFKIAGAAAEAGFSLDDVERLARLANERTRSLGVAFSGCTIPGASNPLFVVPEGSMAVGLGIHGEPGISENPLTSADGLAELLVDRLLEELPEGVDGVAGSRAVVILNGLGSVKYEELFTVFGAVSARLAAAGVEIVEPECGELVTSLDMAGVSLTLFWVDDVLEKLWLEPADTPAYRKGVTVSALADESTTGSSAADSHPQHARPNHAGPDDERPNDARPSEASRAAARSAVDLVRCVQRAVLEGEDEFGRIDAVAGDGDHGIGMSRGATGALAAAERVVAEGGGIGRLLAEAGEAWSEQGGGTSGALWGIALTAAGASIAREFSIDAVAITRAVDAALVAVQNLGGAEVGDKTLIDAFVPFATELRTAVAGGTNLTTAWVLAAEKSSDAADATTGLLPRLGRARPHAERSLGHPDAGAVSFARIVTSLGERLSTSGAR